jgi:hypothetical protein
MKAQSIIFYLLIPCLVATSFFTGYTWHEAKTEKELSQVVDWNTKQIRSIAVVSATESFEADCLLQILHALDDQEFEVPKKDRIFEMLDFNDVYPIEDDDVDHTFEQVEKDQREVDQCIRGFGSGNLFQAETLLNILNKLKDKS